MFRLVCVSAPLLMLALQTPAVAQTKSADKPAATATAKKCELSKKKKRGSSMFGAVLGSVAGGMIGGRAGVFTPFIPVARFSTVLTTAIACRLDEKEQEKAAAATNQAVRGGVGTTSSWESETREGVSGSSTVTAQTASASGGGCMDVNDVIIVNGEETTVSKKMCRAPGAAGYTIASV